MHEQFTRVYGGAAPSYSSITDWMRALKERRLLLEDELQTGRPTETVSEERIGRV